MRCEYPDLGGHQEMAPVNFALEITDGLSWALKTFPVPDLLTRIQSLVSLLLTPTPPSFLCGSLLQLLLLGGWMLQLVLISANQVGTDACWENELKPGL